MCTFRLAQQYFLQFSIEKGSQSLKMNDGEMRFDPELCREKRGSVSHVGRTCRMMRRETHCRVVTWLNILPSVHLPLLPLAATSPIP